jgi:outer membrane protein
VRYIKYLLIIASIFATQSAVAITLEEALPFAYKKSDALKVAQETFLSEIESMSQAISAFMPRVSAGVSVSNTKTKRTTGVSNDNDTARDTTTQSLNIAQPIFDGGSGVAGLKTAQAQFRASRGKLYAAEQDTLIDYIDKYLSCYESQEKYKIASSSVEFRQKELEAAEERFKLGEETKTGTAIARAKLAQAQSQKAASFVQMEQFNALFNKIFGVDPVDLSLPSEPIGVPSDLETLVSRSLSANHTMQQVKHSVDAAKSNARAKVGGLLPSVSLKASASRTTYNTPGGNLLSGSQAINNRQLTTSLSVDIPILSKGGAEYSEIRQANSRARSAAHQMNDTLRNVKIEASTLWEQYQAAKVSLDFSEEYVSAQTLALEGMTHEYEVGTKNIIELLDSEEALNQAKTNAIATKKNYILTAYKMKASMGEMTARTLKLDVKYFDPEFEFKKVKAKIIGF